MNVMMFDRSLRGELNRSFVAILLVLIGIMMTVMLVRVLGQASSGRVNPSEVMLVMGYTVLRYLAPILALSLFTAIMATLTRMYASSEMIVWFVCGQRLTAFLRPLFIFAMPILLLTGLAALLAWPWSNSQIHELRNRYQSRTDIERVSPGQFIESAGGQRVFFVDKQGHSDTEKDRSHGANIFVSSSQGEKSMIVAAQAAHLEHDKDGEQVLELDHGLRFEQDGARGPMRFSRFESYRTLLPARIAATDRPRSPRQTSTRRLFAHASPADLGELSWRLGLLLAAINSVLLGLAISGGNPRTGRGANLVFALAAFTTYYNLLSVGQDLVARSKVGFWTWLITLHGLVFLLCLSVIFWRDRRRKRSDPALATA